MHTPEQKPETDATVRFAPNRPANWRVYAAAAGATLAMAANADASIIYSTFAGQSGSNPEGVITVALPPIPKSPEVGISEAYGSFRVGDALPSRVILGRVVSNGREFKSGADIVARSETYYGGPYGIIPKFYTQKFTAGQPIAGNLREFTQNWVVDLRNDNSRGQRGGVFGPGTVTGFIGFVFTGTGVKGDTGWVRVRLSEIGTPGYLSEVQVIDYAYNDVAGEQILAGQTTDAVPEPGTAALALLATGAGGLLAWRKRRAASLTR